MGRLARNLVVLLLVMLVTVKANATPDDKLPLYRQSGLQLTAAAVGELLTSHRFGGRGGLNLSLYYRRPELRTKLETLLQHMLLEFFVGSDYGVDLSITSGLSRLAGTTATDLSVVARPFARARLGRLWLPSILGAAMPIFGWSVHGAQRSFLLGSDVHIGVDISRKYSIRLGADIFVEMGKPEEPVTAIFSLGFARRLAR